MPPEFEDPLLAEFIRDSAERIARVGNRKLIADVPKHFRPVAESVARQCAGIWSLELYDGDGFKVSTALQVITIGRGFANQCRRVAEMLTSSSNPELKAIFRKLAANSPAALMSAFAHYFVAHEFVHVEQGLGSDQYQDSDHYMSVVTEADHVADVAGLAIAANAAIPELEALDQRQCILLLVAIHIASMHSFQTAAALDLHAFRRLLSWYLHFARLTKAHECPDLGALGFVSARRTRPRVLAGRSSCGWSTRRRCSGRIMHG